MLKTPIALLCILLLGVTLAPASAPDQPAAAPVQDEQKRPVDLLIGSLTKYYIGVFSATPKWGETSAQAIKDQMKKNFANIRELVKGGKLVGLAEVHDSPDYKMVAFLKTNSEEGARTIVDASYAVKSGLLKADVYSVWGTRGMGEGLKKEMEAGSKQAAKKGTYYLTILSKGKAWKEKPDEGSGKLVDAHASAVLKLREAGVLKFYGAVDGSTTIRNFSILKGESVKDVETKLAGGELFKKEWFSPAVYRCTIAAGTLP